jgi:DNA-binding FrmR family transcriptional regulator
MSPGTHYGEKKDDLLIRLRKMEGQVRGLQQMIDSDRYCLDVVQQVNAVTAAAREVSLIALESHLKGIVAEAVTGEDGDTAITEMVTVLRRVLRS